MSRSVVLCTLIVLMSGLGCVAQEPGRASQENKGLQESIARLEEQMARLGEHLKSAQEGQATNKLEQARLIEDRDATMQKMRADFADQQRAWKERQVDQERAIAELKQAVERERKTRAEAEHLRAELASLREHSERRDDDRASALDLLAAERKQIAQLREQVMAELERTEQGASAMERLRDENAQLRDRVAVLERELVRSKQERAVPPAPQPMPPAGTVVINNKEGEIHLHFHGPAPNVVMPPAKTPPRLDDATPGPAGPSGPVRARSRDAAPRKDAAETKDRDDDHRDQKRLNQAPPVPVSNLIEVLLGKL